MGNPFKEEKKRDLLSLDTNDITHPSAAELIFTHHDRGRTRFVEFMDELESEVSIFYEPIKKTRVDIFPTGTTLCGRYKAKCRKR